MSKILEGLWDCPYCGNTGIGGLTKNCPSCGHPQDNDTKFYLGEKKNYLDYETAKNYGKGEDWTCPFCGSLNRYNVSICRECGGDRNESEETYFHKKEKHLSEDEIVERFHKEQFVESEDRGIPLMQPTFFDDDDPANPKHNVSHKIDTNKIKQQFKPSGILFKVICVVLGLIILGTSIFFITKPKTFDATLTDKTWSRNIAVEEYKTVQESDWTLPAGGRLRYTSNEIHHYDEVLDHYDSQQVQHSRQVLDGYDESVVHHDNGDGTFSEDVIRTPRYRTEYYYETEQVPVYKNVPVYKTKYYYDIDKWIHTRDITSKGHFEEPRWGVSKLATKEREGTKTEVYTLIFNTDKKQYKVKVNEDFWLTFEKDTKVTLTTRAGVVTQINNQKV